MIVGTLYYSQTDLSEPKCNCTVAVQIGSAYSFQGGVCLTKHQ